MKKKHTSKKISIEYNLGKRIKFLRETRNLTQVELARIAKVSQATIAHIEKGTKDPSVNTLKQIANAMDTHIATLFGADEVYIFDLLRLRRKYKSERDLTPHLYTALGRVVQFAKDIGFSK